MDGLQVDPGGTLSYARPTVAIKSVPQELFYAAERGSGPPQPDCAPQQPDRFLRDPERDERFFG